jgi:hypothetical protein
MFHSMTSLEPAPVKMLSALRRQRTQCPRWRCRACEASFAFKYTNPFVRHAQVKQVTDTNQNHRGLLYAKNVRHRSELLSLGPENTEVLVGTHINEATLGYIYKYPTGVNSSRLRNIGNVRAVTEGGL